MNPVMLKRYLLCLLFITSGAYADEEHLGHSDHLLMLLQKKILLEKKQQGFESLNAKQRVESLRWQGRALNKTMPVLKEYMATPKSYYLTTEMYHESLENRAAMLADFSQILDVYYRQLSE